VITAVMVAAKFLDDFRLANKDFAKIGGVTTQELNLLEIDLLKTLDFNLHVPRSLFESYLDGLLLFQPPN